MIMYNRWIGPIVIGAITQHTSNLWKGWPFILGLFIVAIALVILIDVDKAKEQAEAYRKTHVSSDPMRVAADEPIITEKTIDYKEEWSTHITPLLCTCILWQAMIRLTFYYYSLFLSLYCFSLLCVYYYTSSPSWIINKRHPFWCNWSPFSTWCVIMLSTNVWWWDSHASFSPGCDLPTNPEKGRRGADLISLSPFLCKYPKWANTRMLVAPCWRASCTQMATLVKTVSYNDYRGNRGCV